MKKISLLSFAMLACLAILFTSCEEEALPLQNDGLTIQDDGAMDLKKGSQALVYTYEDSDWLEAAITDAVDNLDGTWSFTVTWTLSPLTDLGELVKTQGGLTAKVILDDYINLITPKANGKQPKKNFVLYNEVDGLLVADGAIEYTVMFTKAIKALPGEDVEITGDWTSKWVEEELVYMDPDGVPDSGDEGMYCIQHQVGYEEPVMWTVPL